MLLAYQPINPSQQKSVFYGYSNVALHVLNWWADMDRRRKCNVSANNNHYSGKYKVITWFKGASVNHLTPAFCKVNNAVTVLRGWLIVNLKKLCCAFQSINLAVTIWKDLMLIVFHVSAERKNTKRIQIFFSFFDWLPQQKANQF